MIVFTASVCTTTPVVLPQKYILDNHLEAVGSISASIVRDFENIDNQSIILEADRHEYYLLVLHKPIEAEHSYLSIGIESSASRDLAHSTQTIIGTKSTNRSAPSTGFVQAPSKINSIIAGSDRIIVIENSVKREYYIIEKIYKLQGREHANKIKEWLRRY